MPRPGAPAGPGESCPEPPRASLIPSRSRLCSSRRGRPPGPAGIASAARRGPKAEGPSRRPAVPAAPQPLPHRTPDGRSGSARDRRKPQTPPASRPAPSRTALRCCAGEAHRFRPGRRAEKLRRWLQPPPGGNNTNNNTRSPCPLWGSAGTAAPYPPRPPPPRSPFSAAAPRGPLPHRAVPAGDAAPTAAPAALARGTTRTRGSPAGFPPCPGRCRTAEWAGLALN